MYENNVLPNNGIKNIIENINNDIREILDLKYLKWKI